MKWWVAVLCELMLLAAASSNEECKEPLGMANGHINQIKASTIKDDQHLADSAQSKTDEAWCSRSDDPSPYLEISLKDTYRITSITTRGSIRDPRAWVRTYQIRYNTTSSGWVVFSNKTFPGNAHFVRPRTNDFRPAILSNAIRIYPKEVHNFACLKVELDGCLFKSSCSDPGLPDNGAKIGSDFGHGKQVQFVCNSGFSLVGSAVATCNDGRWNSSVPACKASCSDPGSPDNGTKIGPDFRHGNQVQFVCNSGFSLVGSAVATCNEGRWNASVPACKASCSDPGSPGNGAKIGSDFRHGNQVQFVCNSGFGLVGSAVATCNDGRWSASAPACKASCSDPGSPRNGSRIGSNFGHGQRIHFACDAGLVLEGDSVALCNEGRWNTSVPFCAKVPDVCRDYELLDDPTRAQSYSSQAVLKCDRDDFRPGWYRFSGGAGSQMPGSCVPIKRCGTHAPGWLNGTHPTNVGSTVIREVCYHWKGNCCRWKNRIKVRNCGGFFVYELKVTRGCHLRYCGNG